jgi:geranylgeranyl diphosphate synthase type II
LDVTSTPEAMGKAVGKDSDAGKQTYPRSVGAQESQRAGLEAVETAVAALAGYGEAANDLRTLARFCLDRKH